MIREHLPGASCRRTLLTASLVLLCAFAPSANARQDAEPKQPDSGEQAQEPPDDEKVLVGSLKGVRLVPRQEDVLPQADVEGIRSEGMDLLDTNDFRQRLEPFLGRPVSMRSIRDMTDAVRLYFRDRDRPVVTVAVPQQDITNGVLQFVVVEAKVGEVSVEGNEWFSASRIRRHVRLDSGDVILLSRLLDDIGYINRNPFRRVTPVFSPGQEPGTTDLLLRTEDRLPIRAFSGFENSGNETVGENLYLAGFNWGGSIGPEHHASYQFMTDTKIL
ncbi:MAG: POTRA domain-containing protein, partial [Planctomycetota bacterium]